MVKHIAGKTKYWKLKIGDTVVNKSGNLITGKGKGICLNGKWADYKDNSVLIQTENPYGSTKDEITLSKKEIKVLLKNFKDSR